MNSTISPLLCAQQISFTRSRNRKSEKENKKIPSFWLLNPPVLAAVHINNALDARFTKTQKKKIYGAAAAAGALALAFIAVGRNPVKAAQTLTGSTVKTKPYKAGEELLNELLQKQGGQYSVNLEDFKTFFKKNDKFDFEKAIDGLCEFVKNNKETTPVNVSEALDNIQTRVGQLILDRKEGFLTMEGVSLQKAEQFLKSNANDMNILGEFFQKGVQSSKDNTTLAAFKILEDNFMSAKPNAIENFHKKINAFEICPDDLLPNDSVYYHGTGKTRKIFKQGITPFNSNELGMKSLMPTARECGAAVYLTPDESVAQAFAGSSGPCGKILSYKANDMQVGIISQEGMLNLYKMVNDFTAERMPVEDAVSGKNSFAMTYNFIQSLKPNITANEMLLRKIMLDNGYDAVYTAKGINSLKDIDAAKHVFDVNSQLGRPESQFVVYSPEKLELLPRTLKQRIVDVKDRSLSFAKVIRNYIKSWSEIYKDMLNSLSRQ